MQPIQPVLAYVHRHRLESILSKYSKSKQFVKIVETRYGLASSLCFSHSGSCSRHPTPKARDADEDVVLMAGEESGLLRPITFTISQLSAGENPREMLCLTTYLFMNLVLFGLRLGRNVYIWSMILDIAF